MKSFLISSDQETLIGMRLAGVQGVVMTKKEDILKLMEEKIKDNETGIVIITKAIMKMAEKEIRGIWCSRRVVA